MRTLVRNLLTSAAAVAVVAGATMVAPTISSFDKVAEPIAAGDTHLDEFNFSAANPAGGTSSISLSAGTPYRIDIAGTFVPNNTQPVWHDAECTGTSASPDGSVPATPGQREDGLDDEGNTADVYVAGSEVDWTPPATDASPVGCNDENHLYSYTYTPGTSGPVSLAVNDDWHGDNNGTLFVRIYPGEATTTTTTTVVDAAKEKVDEVEATGQDALNTVNDTAREKLGEAGIDPDDPNGTIDRKREEAEGAVPDPGTDPGDVTGAVEDAIEGEPDNTVGTVEDEIEDHNPNPDPDLGPVAEALDGALTQIGAFQAEAEEEAEEMTGSELPSETPAVDDPDPGENDPEQDPDPEPTPEPEPDPKTETKPETEGDSGSESTKTNQNRTTSSPVTTGDETVVHGAAETSNDEGAGGTGSGTAAASNGAAKSPNASGDGGLLPIDFAIGEEVTDVTDERAPRARVSTDEAPQPTNKAVLAMVALALIVGTSEMARRALRRLRAERVYSAYRYR